MNYVRGKRLLAILLSCAMCFSMNTGFVYAEEIPQPSGEDVEVVEIIEETEETEKQETELEETEENLEDVNVEMVSEDGIVEEASYEEANVGDPAEEQPDENPPATVSMMTLSVDKVNKIIYTAGHDITILEEDSKTKLLVSGASVSYLDLSGQPLETPLEDAAEYIVAGGNEAGKPETRVAISMNSGKVAGIIGARGNQTSEVLIDVQGGIVGTTGILLTKETNGKVTGNARIRVGVNATVGKIDTTNPGALGTQYSQVTVEPSGSMTLIGNGESNRDTFVIHNNTISTNVITATNVENSIEFDDDTTRENYVVGEVKGSVVLCDELNIAENEIVRMEDGKIGCVADGIIINNGAFEVYRKAELVADKALKVSGNNLVIKEATFTAKPVITAPQDNDTEQSATIAGGDMTAFGKTLTPTRLVQHNENSDEAQLTGINTNTQDGKGEYIYTFSYEQVASGVVFDPNVVFYFSEAVVPIEEYQEIDNAGGTLKLTYRQFVGGTSVTLRLNRGGAIYASITLPYGMAGQVLENKIAAETGGTPEIEGKTFDGWYALVENEELSIYDGGFAIAPDVKNLYAKWKTAEKVTLAIRDFEDGTLVRRTAVYGDTYLSDESAIDYSRDFYTRTDDKVYKAQKTGAEDEGEAYDGATKVTAVTSVSDNVYTIYAKYGFDATTFSDDEDSEFSFAFKKKAKVIEEEGEPVVAYNYTGRQIQPAVVVKQGKTTLKENDDYTLRYDNNINATGTSPDAKVIIEGRGIYSGSVELSFVIQPKSIRGVKIGQVGTLPLDSADSYSDTIVVMDGDLVVEAEEYQLVFEPKLNADEEPIAGRGKIKVYGTGKNYIESETVCVSKTVTFIDTEGKTDISTGFTVDTSQPQYAYTGNLVKPKATVGNAATVLKEGTDYRLVYQNNRNVGKEAKVYAIGCGQYYGKTEACTFEITQRLMKRASIKSIGSITYTGNVITGLKLRVTDGKNILVEDVDYTISVNETENNINVSTGAVRASVTIEGVKNEAGVYTGNYQGVKVAKFKIKKRNINNDNAVNVYTDEYSWSYAYTGGEIKPVIGLSYGGVMLEEGKDYTVSYKNNVKSFLTSGKISTMTIKGKGNFTGSKSFMFFIF